MEISLAVPLISRDGSLDKDPLMYNCYWEADTQGKRIAIRRPAVGAVSATIPFGTVQGALHQGSLDYCILGDTLVGIPSIGTANVAIPGVVYPNQRMDAVTSLLSGSNANTSFFKSISGAWCFTNNAVTQITNANYPANTVPGAVYLDGSYYVMDTVGKIWGSDIDNCTSWSALNFVSVDRGLGKSVALHRHLNYVTAFCEKGTEFFYNAANPAPGSPLSPVVNATQAIGCAHGDSIAAMDGMTIFLGRDANNGRSFYAIEGLSFRRISTPDVDRVLEKFQFNPTRGNYQNLYSMIVKGDGHAFYLFTLTDKNLTLAYDITNNHWAQWSTVQSGADGLRYMPFNWLVAVGSFSAGSGSASTYLIQNGGGAYATFAQGDQAGGEQVYMLVRTHPLDAGTSVRKFCSEISLLGDTVTANMDVRYSNNEGQTWSTVRTINLGLSRKRLTRLGSFFRRVYELKVLTAAKVRLEGLVIPDRNLPSQTQPTGE